MNTEEVEKEYCSRCPSYKYGCGFITRGLQDKCSQLSDYTDGYERGYKQAEKDNELTWEDIEEIYLLVIEKDNAYMEANAQNDYQYDVKEMYQEVLKRFNKQRKEE